ncbi:oligosaccharide repeat unit polymerase [Polaribacter sp. IC073]|uniref:oligosaccharide repeat unit polymerase n=1 Tax=Polaribacter sp. IC073 TaxID=2508540 RepID=UPI0011BE7A1D|nr:oligosaccharide repeat unit polymerase [Polaribacter sp. IC073]TXD49697.1 oligosaccharide repeat unit polymerase [Polaribacter sp. IC073]
MIIQLLQKKEHKVYLFIIFYIILDFFLSIASNFFEAKGFALTPYFRILLILFTVIYFVIDFFNINMKRKVNKLFTFNEIFVYGWFAFAMLSISLGLINRNPIIYIITDFLYVLIGTVLFYIFQYLKSNQTYDFFDISKILIVLGIICITFNLKVPAILLVLMIVFVYVNIIKKKYFSSLFLLIPYFIMVLSSNRTQLVVFFIMVLLLLLRKSRNYFSTNSVIVFGISLLILAFCFKVEVLQTLLYFFNPKSNIGFRIYQIIVIFKEGIDYSSSFFVSISQRIIEVQVVIEYWTSDFVTFIFGSGSGGTIDGSKLFNDNSVLNSALLGGEKIHNIHILPFSLIFRYGFIGLMLFLMLLLIVYKSIIKVLNEKTNEQKLFWNLFLIFWFFFSIPAASFLWSMPVFWISLAYTNRQT